MSTLKAGKLQHPDAANSSIEFDSSGNITKFVGPSGGADGNVLTKSGTAPAWTSAGAVGGLVLITSETFSAVSSLSVNDCFTSTYANYRVVLSGNSSNNDQVIRLRLRASGTDNSTASSYVTQTMFADSTSVSGVRNTLDVGNFCWFTSGLRNVAAVDFANPAQATATVWASFATDSKDNARIIFNGGTHNQTTAYDGFSIFPTGGTITGTIRVYGYKD